MNPINDGIALAGQLHADEISALAEQGYQQIICNRPDDEAPEQPRFETIRTFAEQYGMTAVYAPVFNNEFTQEAIAKTHNALQKKKKTVMYCRSGMRSSLLWAICETHSGKDIQETIARANDAGYELASLHDFIVSATDHIEL